MSWTVHKFELDSKQTALQLPATARAIHAAMQGDKLCLWVWLERDAPCVERYFTVVGTGRAAPEPALHGASHVATVHAGPNVWHVFEVVP